MTTLCVMCGLVHDPSEECGIAKMRAGACNGCSPHVSHAVECSVPGCECSTRTPHATVKPKFKATATATIIKKDGTRVPVKGVKLEIVDSDALERLMQRSEEEDQGG